MLKIFVSSYSLYHLLLWACLPGSHPPSLNKSGFLLMGKNLKFSMSFLLQTQPWGSKSLLDLKGIWKLHHWVWMPLGQGQQGARQLFDYNIVSSLTNAGFSVHPLHLSFLPGPVSLPPLPPIVPLWKVFLGRSTWLPISPKARVPPSFLHLLSAGEEPLGFIWYRDSQQRCFSHVWIPPRSCLERGPQGRIHEAFHWHLLAFVKHLENNNWVELDFLFTTGLKEEQLS